MSSFKYTRLPSSEPSSTSIKFEALDGPSYFSYDVPRGKYKSAFTYSNSVTTYSAFKNEEEDPPPSMACRICSSVATVLCYLLFIMTLPMSIYFTLKRIKVYEQIVIYRLGLLKLSTGPGYVIVLPCIDRWTRVDLRMKAFSVPPQKIVTADGAVIEIGAEVYFQVKDAVHSVGNVQDLNHSTRIICQTSLQKQLGKQSLSDIESDRLIISKVIQDDVNQMTRTWGVEVNKIDLSSVKLYSQPNSLFSQSNNPLSFLGPVLFPPGTSNAPVDQLQHFFGGGFTPDKKVTESQNLISLEAAKSASDYQGINSSGDLINAVNSHMGAALVKEFGYIYKFVLTAEKTPDENGIFFLDLKNGEGQAGFGYPMTCEPDVTLTMTSGLFRDLLTKQVSAFNAYMGGQLMVSGDLRAAMKLGGLVETVTAIHK